MACENYRSEGYYWHSEEEIAISCEKENEFKCNDSTLGQYYVYSCGKKPLECAGTNAYENNGKCYSCPEGGGRFAFEFSYCMIRYPYPDEGDCSDFCSSLGYQTGDIQTGKSCGCVYPATETWYVQLYRVHLRTCIYLEESPGYLGSPTVSRTDDPCSTGTSCTVSSSRACTGQGDDCYWGSSCSASCSGQCDASYNGRLQYYCSLTNTYYDNQSEATSACTNYCPANYGLYSGTCYQLT